ncbi:interferon gamma receptor 1 [Anomaloglossus baeobatrachus]|uniref:interferon gamma receptor 1 n=1 Tax=Anomaloglossus baeobatrachus TaxID=238106 RepID=UPI003F4F8613
MDAILTGSLPVLLLATLTAAAIPTGGPVPVQTPFNLQKKSYNFNSTLHWDYNLTSVTPYFQVEYRSYKTGGWMIVETCLNISHNYCDLSEIIDDPFIRYKVQVKALVGSEMSSYASTEFYLINDGIIGPPKMNASVNGKFIVIDIWYPDVPHVNDKQTVGDHIDDLGYEIYHGNETKEAEECDFVACSVRILIKDQSKFCFSAQAKSNRIPMTMERSKEECINTLVTNDTSKNLQAIIVSVVVVVVIILVLCFFIIKRKMKAKSVLPKSLRTIAKAMTTQKYLLSDQITKYDQVSVSPAESPEEKVTPEEKMTPEEPDKEQNMSDDSDIKESTDNGYHSSVQESEQRTDEDQNEMEESSGSKNYYRTENSDSTIVCVTEDDVPSPEPPRDVRPAGNSYGYDKPHCPL